MICGLGDEVFNENWYLRHVCDEGTWGPGIRVVESDHY
jgi:hypothetical protein